MSDNITSNANMDRSTADQLIITLDAEIAELRTKLYVAHCNLRMMDYDDEERNLLRLRAKYAHEPHTFIELTKPEREEVKRQRVLLTKQIENLRSTLQLRQETKHTAERVIYTQALELVDKLITDTPLLCHNANNELHTQAKRLELLTNVKNDLITALESHYALHPVSHKSVNFYAYLHPEEYDEEHLPPTFDSSEYVNTTREPNMHKHEEQQQENTQQPETTEEKEKIKISNDSNDKSNSDTTHNDDDTYNDTNNKVTYECKLLHKAIAIRHCRPPHAAQICICVGYITHDEINGRTTFVNLPITTNTTYFNAEDNNNNDINNNNKNNNNNNNNKEDNVQVHAMIDACESNDICLQEEEEELQEEKGSDKKYCDENDVCIKYVVYDRIEDNKIITTDVFAQEQPHAVMINEIDQVVYQGDVNARGERDGNGIGIFANGTLYLGAWKSNQRIASHAIQYNTDGSKYEGEFQSDAMESDHAQWYLPNGDVYCGEVRDGVRVGYGCLHMTNGDVYDGEWNDNCRDGHGTCTYATGFIYNGEWHHDQRDGEGVLRKVLPHTDSNVLNDDDKINTSNTENSITTTTSNNSSSSNNNIPSKSNKGEKKVIVDDNEEEEVCNKITDIISEQDNNNEMQVVNANDKATEDTIVATYRNGGAYRGKWKNDVKHGPGAVLFTNCTKYDGKWKEGTRRGQAGAFSTISLEQLNTVADDLEYQHADGDANY